VLVDKGFKKIRRPDSVLSRAKLCYHYDTVWSDVTMDVAMENSSRYWTSHQTG